MGNQFHNQFQPMFLQHLECLPFDPEAKGYVSWSQKYIPYVHTDWREETLSWKKTCYIATQLSALPKGKLTGPDTIKLLSDVSVNSFVKFPVGSIKHMIYCTEEGAVAFHGLVFRLAEDCVEAHVDSFYLQYQAEKGGYNVTFGTGVAAVFQLGGPRSLEIVERAAKEDFHDLKFMRFRYGTIAGHKVRITRMGMAGTLSYEVHCDTNEEAIDVYNEIIRVGTPLGIVKLGINAYMSNHTENGYPQLSLHFPQATYQIQGYSDYLRKVMGDLANMVLVTRNPIPRGTLSNNIDDYCRNPYELGWGHMVKFDHDFIGRAALEKISQSHREMVTLVWNHEDMMKVFASFFEKDGEPYLDMPFQQDINMMGANLNHYYQFKVMKDGKEIGVAMWRTYTLYYRETISLCCIDPEYAKIGTDVTILYGDTNRRTLEIRAKVERYPYLDLTPNYQYDVEAIPHYQE